MKKISFYLNNHEYNSILEHTKHIHTFIRKAIHSKLNADNEHTQNFSEIKQRKNYNPHFEGNGIKISGRDIIKNHGYAEIFGDMRQLELKNGQSLSTVKNKNIYTVIGENPQINAVIIRQIK